MCKIVQTFENSYFNKNIKISMTCAVFRPVLSNIR